MSQSYFQAASRCGLANGLKFVGPPIPHDPGLLRKGAPPLKRPFSFGRCGVGNRDFHGVWKCSAVMRSCRRARGRIIRRSDQVPRMRGRDPVPRRRLSYAVAPGVSHSNWSTGPVRAFCATPHSHRLDASHRTTSPSKAGEERLRVSGAFSFGLDHGRRRGRMHEAHACKLLRGVCKDALVLRSAPFRGPSASGQNCRPLCSPCPEADAEQPSRRTRAG